MLQPIARFILASVMMALASIFATHSVSNATDFSTLLLNHADADQEPQQKPVDPELDRDDASDKEDAPVEDDQLDRLRIENVTEQVNATQIFPDRQPTSVGLAEIIVRSLGHSKSIRVLRYQPAEERQFVNQEFGQFDWRAFVDAQFGSDNQPVGDLLQTNLAINQVRNDRNEVRYGLRKNTIYGGSIELSDSLGTRDSNSGLLVPDDQGTASVRVIFSQELLRGGGRDVVLSRALIAALSADQSYSESRAEISNLLRDTLIAYWNLYEARGNYFIQLSLIRWAEDTLRILESRGDIDAEQNSIEQARALLLEARADLTTSKASVLIAQDEIYRLVNAPDLNSDFAEILTTEFPQTGGQLFGVSDEVQIALANRDEIPQRLSEIREAALDHHVSLNQLLPRLTLSLETSLNGLDDDFDFFGAHSNLTDINPSYQANVNFEYFIGNRTSRARNKQAKIAFRRLQVEYEDQIEQIRLEVSRAIRTLNASTEILMQRRDTLQARQKEIRYLRLRRDEIPGEGTSTTLLLEQLFQAINRLVGSQTAYVAALANQQAARAELLRAKGLLLDDGQVCRDMRVGVPSAHRALKQQLRQKENVVNESCRRVVVPGKRKRIPVHR